MNKLKILSCLLVLGMYMPLQAQVVYEDIADNDSSEVTDVALMDTLSDDSVALPWPQNAQARIDKLLTHDMFETSQLGMMVYDLTADSVIYAHNERQLMRPASTMKVVTAITALDKLGGSYQFKTALYYTGTIQNRTLTGDLYCVGGFDPKFGRDDMRAFTHCMKTLGVDTIRGNLYADKSMKDLDVLGEGWCWDDDNPVLSPLVYRRKDHFMTEFEKELREAGIQVEAFSSVAKCPAEAIRICERTHSIDQILLPMMKKSDNLYAEALFYQLVPRENGRTVTAKAVRAVVRRLINKVGLDASRYKIADGSGLSLYNYVSVELLVKLLKYGYQHQNIYHHLLPSMPTAGVDGTLKKRLRGTHTHGKVWAKTGTVTGVTSLAGYCEASNGHLLCFAIINQGVMYGKNGRAFQDRVCRALCLP